MQPEFWFMAMLWIGITIVAIHAQLSAAKFRKHNGRLRRMNAAVVRQNEKLRLIIARRSAADRDEIRMARELTRRADALRKKDS